MVDFLRRRGGGTDLRGYYRFLVPFPSLATVYPDHKRRLRRRESPWPYLMSLVGGAAGFTAAIVAVRWFRGVALLRSSFVLDHAAMLVTFVVAIESLSRALYGAERLAGFDTAPIIRNAYLSRTVSEFWGRYNHRVHDWLYLHVFLPTGGRRAPARSVLLVFLVSGVFHEVMFAAATSRLTGYQLAFFTVQGPAALASGHLERLARRGGLAGKVVAHGATILFFAVTSVLFFHGVGEVFPFIYASRPPLPSGVRL
jgi:hypothetical protein